MFGVCPVPDCLKALVRQIFLQGAMKCANSLIFTYANLFLTTLVRMYAQSNISCLAIAAFKGHLSVVQYLCSRGNKQLMALKDNMGNSPLALAKQNGHTAVVEYLKRVGMQS